MGMWQPPLPSCSFPCSPSLALSIAQVPARPALLRTYAKDTDQGLRLPCLCDPSALI